VSSALAPLLQLQRFYVPALVIFAGWAVWRTVFRKDVAVGLALYIGLVIVVDSFFNTGIYLPGLATGSVRYSEVCAAVLLFNRPSAPANPGALSRRVRLLLIVYFGLMAVSALRANSMAAGAFEFRGVIIPQITAWLVACRGLGATAQFRRFILCLMAFVLIISLFVLFDVLFDRWLLISDQLFKPEYGVNRQHGRFGGFFFNPNYMGAFAVLVFPLAFVFALNERQWFWPRLLAWMTPLALVFCLVETQSRAPLISFAIELALLTVGPCGGLSKKRRLLMLGVLALVLVVLMPGFFEHAIVRFNELNQETEGEGRTRHTIWEWTERLIAANPILGIGFGEQQFVSMMDSIGYRDVFGQTSLDNPHNSYLQIAVYAGIPALIVFILANGLVLARAVRVSVSRTVDSNGSVIFGLTVGIAGFLASIYPDMHLFTRSVAPVYWVFFGLLYSSLVVVRGPADAANRAGDAPIVPPPGG